MSMPANTHVAAAWREPVVPVVRCSECHNRSGAVGLVLACPGVVWCGRCYRDRLAAARALAEARR